MVENPKFTSSEPQKVAVGDLFTPFERTTIALPPTLTEYNISRISISPFEFQSIRGTVVLSADTNYFIGNFITPAGPADLVQRYQNGKSHIIKAPLTIHPEFILTSKEDYRTLNQFYAEINIGSRSFRYPCQENDKEIEEELLGTLEEEGRATLYLDYIEDGKGTRREILFPWNKDVISKINFRFLALERQV